MDLSALAEARLGRAVIIPKNQWAENWTSPAFDTLGERDEKIEIYGRRDSDDFEAG